MRRVSSFSVLLFGFALALAGLVSVAQAQTAPQVTQTDAQIAPQVEIEIETFDAASTSLRAQYAEMVRHSGKVLLFGAAGEAAERFVLYAPLNRLWLLDAAGEVTRHAWIEVAQKPVDHLVLHWTHWLDGDVSDILPAGAQMPVFTVAANALHPLATAYDALLARPLAHPVGSLPAAAYFSAGGHVFDGAGAQIGEWDSYGPEIALRLIPAQTPAQETGTGANNPESGPDPATKPLWQWFAVADLAAALTPEQPTQLGEN